MPRVFSPVDITQEEKELRKDYFDRHTPRILCSDEAESGSRLCVKIVVGEYYTHPAETDHYIGFLQLWNRETLLAEVRYTPDALEGKSGNLEADVFITVPAVSMNLTAMSYCTRHGLWTSEPRAVKIIR